MADATDYRYKVQVTNVHDGDTVTVVVDLGFWIAHTTPVRLARINAPELSTAEGRAAQQALAAYVSARPGQWTVQTFRSGEDKYGRWLADVYDSSGVCVNDWLVANGYAVPIMAGGLGAALLAVAGLLNGNGPRVAWALSTACFAVAFVLALVGAVHA